VLPLWQLAAAAAVAIHSYLLNVFAQRFIISDMLEQAGAVALWRTEMAFL
jgi:hypothetical protein